MSEPFCFAAPPPASPCDDADPACDAIRFDGLDAALVGFGWQFAHPVAIYDRDRAIACFVEQGMTGEEAAEMLSFNVEGAWLGVGTPVFVESPACEGGPGCTCYVCWLHLTP